jgi:hypothetical protein
MRNDRNSTTIAFVNRTLPLPAVFVLFTMASACVAAASKPAPDGVVVSVRGTVTATGSKSGESARTLVEHDAVWADDTVTTAPDASIEVRIGANGATWSLHGSVSKRVDKSLAWTAPKASRRENLLTGAKDRRTEAAGPHSENQAATSAKSAPGSITEVAAHGEGDTTLDTPVAVPDVQPVAAGVTHPSDNEGTHVRGAGSTGVTGNGPVKVATRGIKLSGPKDSAPPVWTLEDPGALEPAALQEALGGTADAVATCAADSKVRTATDIVLRIGVLASGRVGEVSIDADPLDLVPLESCLDAVLRGVTIPSAKDTVVRARVRVSP